MEEQAAEPEAWRLVDCERLPRCPCGHVARFAACGLCENHYAENAERYHGRDQLVKTLVTEGVR
jgi:hypothetical protein